MKQTTTVFLVTFLATVFITAPVALAKEEKQEKKKSQVQIQNEIRIENKSGNEASSNVEIKSQGSNSLFHKIEIDEETFAIMGDIEAVGSSDFSVAGYSISIDPSQVSKYKQMGILEVGKTVKVKGIIKDGKKFATEVMVIGTGQGRYKIEINNHSDSTSQPQPIPSALPTTEPLPTDFPSTTATPSANPSPTASASAAPITDGLPTTLLEDVMVKLKTMGSIEQVTAFIDQIHSFFANVTNN